MNNILNVFLIICLFSSMSFGQHIPKNIELFNYLYDNNLPLTASTEGTTPHYWPDTHENYNEDWNGYEVSLDWFGAKTDLKVAIKKAVAFSKKYQSGAFAANMEMVLPAGVFPLNDTIHINSAISIRGQIGLNNSNSVVNIGNSGGFVINHSQTSPNGTTADGTTFRSIKFNGTGRNAVCIEAHAQVNLYDLQMWGFDRGVWVSADGSQGTGNANKSFFQKVITHDCNEGIVLAGDDGNASILMLCQANNCTYGIVDSSLLANVFIGCQTEDDSVAYLNTNTVSTSLYLGCYAEGAGNDPDEKQLIDLRDKAMWIGGTIGDTSQIIGNTFFALSGVNAMEIVNSKHKYSNDFFNLEVGNVEGSDRFFKMRSLGDIDPGLIWDIDGRNDYSLRHRGIDPAQIVITANNTTTSINGNNVGGGQMVLTGGAWLGDGLHTNARAIKMQGSDDPLNIVTPVDGQIVFNSDPATGEPSYWQRVAGSWIGFNVIP